MHWHSFPPEFLWKAFHCCMLEASIHSMSTSEQALVVGHAKVKLLVPVMILLPFLNIVHNMT